MDPELSEADLEALNKLADDFEKLNQQWKRIEESMAESLRIQAAYKAPSMDEKLDRTIALLEKMMPTPKSESEPELCVSVEMDMLSRGTTDAIEVDEDSSKPELESKAYLSPVYVDRSNDDDQVSLDLVLLSDSALVEIMTKSKQTLMSAKTDMESFVAIFDYKTKHMTVNESEESLLALINSENLCMKHVRQNASEYILPVEVESSLLCQLQLWKGIKGVQRCLYVKLVDGNFVYDKGKSHMYANEWQEAGVERKMKVSMDAVTYNSVLAKPTDFGIVHKEILSIDSSSSLVLQKHESKDENVESGVGTSVCALNDSLNVCPARVRQYAHEMIVYSLSTEKPPPLPPEVTRHLVICRGRLAHKGNDICVSGGEALRQLFVILNNHISSFSEVNMIETIVGSGSNFCRETVQASSESSELSTGQGIEDRPHVPADSGDVQVERTEEETNAVKDCSNAQADINNLVDEISFNPNAFTEFNLAGTEEEINGDEQSVRKISVYLKDVVVPTFIQDLCTLEVSPMGGQTLTEALHAQGINVRHYMKKSAVSSNNWRADMERHSFKYIHKGTAVADPSKSHGAKFLNEEYSFVNDGLLMWFATEKMVKTYFNYYHGPSIVLIDKELQAWYSQVVITSHTVYKDAEWWPFLVFFRNNIFIFSVPRPPEVAELNHEVGVEAKEVHIMSFGQAHVKNKVLHLLKKWNESTLQCGEITNLEGKVFRRMEECYVLGT